MSRPRGKMIGAFTLVELLVSVAIFVFMTALLMAKYGNFNQSVLLTNLAYDVALTLRTAQTYGLSVRGESSQFQSPYGVAFCSNNCVSGMTNQKIVIFADNNGDKIYSSSDFLINSYAIKRGAKVAGFCLTDPCSMINSSVSNLNVSFQRPHPDAIICSGSPCASSSYAKIFLQAPDNGIRHVVVRKNGQISVEN